MQYFTLGDIPDGRVTRIDYYNNGTIVCFKSFSIPQHIFVNYHEKFCNLFDFDPYNPQDRQHLADYIKVMSDNRWDPTISEISDLLSIHELV